MNRGVSRLFLASLLAGTASFCRQTLADDGSGAPPAWTVEGGREHALMGFSVGDAGDVNGDEYADVLVEVVGRVELYLGSPRGLESSPAWSVPSIDTQNAKHLAGAGAGDVNADGYDDVLVPSPAGRISLYLGSAPAPQTVAIWSAPGGLAAGSGDVNGDGFADVIVANGEEFQSSRVHLYLGSLATGLESTPAWVANGALSSPCLGCGLQTAFGSSLSSAGDVNGDGFADVVIGDPIQSAAFYSGGAAYLFLGSAGGLSLTPSWTYRGANEHSELGAAVSLAGDVNTDGYGDVLVGEPGYRNDQSFEGRALLFLGSATGLAPSPAWTNEVNKIGAHFGKSLSATGDVNADGYDDVIVGAPNLTNGQSEEGRAYVYLGSPAGLNHRSYWTAEGNEAFDNFARSVSGAGDVNGDGMSEILVGAPGHSNGDNNEGAAFLYAGPLAFNVIVDNGKTGTSFTGDWRVSSAPASYRSGSVWSKATSTLVPTYRFEASLPPGDYEVFEWHTVFSTRTHSARHVIQRALGSTGVVVDQSVNGGRWNSLGVYTFGGKSAVSLRAEDRERSTNADAVRFQCVAARPPAAVIDSIAPQPARLGERVCFTGHGESLAAISEYEWTSSLRPGGVLSRAKDFCVADLSPGTHTISFRVRDSFGTWSAPVQETLLVQTSDCETEVILDDSSPGTSSRGAWQQSSAAGFFGTGSLWAKPGTSVPDPYFAFETTVSAGIYEVFEWHTHWSSRNRTAHHVIAHGGGATTVIVNQSVNGGRWNSLGRYSFSGIARVTILGNPLAGSSTSSDAVRFLRRCDP